MHATIYVKVKIIETLVVFYFHSEKALKMSPH